MPVSTKSAATPTFTSAQYKEEIKRHISNDAAAKTFFAGYSSMKVDELASIIKKYEAKVKKDQAKAAKVTTTAAPKAVPPKVAAKPTSKAKEPVKVEKVPTKKVEKIVSTKAKKPAIAKKPVVKAHGSSDEKLFEYTIIQAEKFVENKAVDKMIEAFSDLSV